MSGQKRDKRGRFVRSPSADFDFPPLELDGCSPFKYHASRSAGSFCDHVLEGLEDKEEKNSMLLFLGEDAFWVYGGPYRKCPRDWFGVKMAEEIDTPCDVDIPTRDFSVPDVKQLRDGLVKTCLALKDGKDVYVGLVGHSQYHQM